MIALISRLLPSGWLRWLALAALLLALLAGAYWAGRRDGIAAQNLAQAQALTAAVEAARAEERERQTITLQIDFAYLRAVQDLRVVYQTITTEVPRYVTAEADHACPVTAGFAELHDAAAGSRLPVFPDAPGGADAATGIPLSAVADKVADNYGRCAETAARLVSLQEWVRQQAAVNNPPPVD